MRGVAPERIFLEDSGTNTRAEALNIIRLISNLDQRISNNKNILNSTFYILHSTFKSLLIVTSPEHLRRAVLAFRKAGFIKVDGFLHLRKPLNRTLHSWAAGLAGENGSLT